ncbi:MAG: cytochrome c biogenesis protein DipZ [Mycobacterium sp.]
MLTLIGIGFVGGLITGVSPCILPVLPVIFFAGATTDASGTPSATAPSDRTRPYRVIAGLVVSFSLVTLTGATLLSLLHLPQDTIRWIALIALIAIGLGLIFPQFETLLEKPFARLPMKQADAGRSGFTFGLALGALYVPCAGPVLAAIIVAGATGTIGVNTVALTLSFAVGTALPLLAFALAGNRLAERVGAFRRRQRAIRIAAGVVTMLLAVGLVFNLPAAVQRAIPDYTHALQDKVASPGQLTAITAGDPSACPEGASELQNCGAAPDFAGIGTWFNTPGNAPINLQSLRGKVVLVDFWAYSCINCQRAIAHVENWYRTYHDQGLEVIGVHTPEYAFERVPENVRAGAADLSITYPVALDNDYATWNSYHNNYWPAEYLIDAQGNIRHTKFGEGDYDATEGFLRQLLSQADTTAKLPPTTSITDQTPNAVLTPETYLGAGRAENYGGSVSYAAGTTTFDYPRTLADNKFALRGRWAVDDQSITAQGDGAVLELNYQAHDVYLVVGGTGILTVTQNGHSNTVPVSGAPNMRTVVSGNNTGSGHVEIGLSPGLQAYSFTFG